MRITNFAAAVLGSAVLLSACSSSVNAPPASLTTAGPPVSLLPYLNSSGDISLLDPALAISSTNPDNLDTSLAAPLAASTCNGCFDQSKVFFSGTAVGTAVSNLHAARLVYVERGNTGDAGGSVLKLNLSAGAPVPVQISSLTGVCRIVRTETTDFGAIDHSVVVVERTGSAAGGPDALCSTAADNVVTAIRLDTLSTAGGTDLPLVLNTGNPLHAQTDSTGAIIGFLSFESAAPGSFGLMHRDVALANAPTLLQDLAVMNPSGAPDTTGANIERTDLTHLFVTAIPFGGGLKLFRAEPDGVSLSLLYDFTGFNAGNPILNGVHDATNLYFSDQNLLLRIPASADAMTLDSTTVAAVIATMSCPPDPAAPCLRIGNRTLASATSPGRVVFDAQDAGNTVVGGVFSAATDAAADQPATTLANNPDTGTAALLLATQGRAYIDLASPSTQTARQIDADGTSSSVVTIADAYWAGSNRATAFNFATDWTVPTESIFLATSVLAVSGVRSDTLRVTNPATGVPAELAGMTVLGTVDGVTSSKAIEVAGLGRFTLARVEMDRPATDLDPAVIDDDVYFLDTATANSLTARATVRGGNDIPLNN